MSKQTMIKKWRQLILLIAITSLLSVAVHAQETSQDKGQAQTKAPLELKLSTMTTAPCIGSPLVLELELTNVSQEDISISKVRLWKEFSYSYSAPDGRSRGGGRGWNTNAPEAKFILQPGMTYRSTHEFSLDSDFFQEVGNYTLKTQLDSIFSNEVKFELYDCGKPQKVEEQK